MTEWCYISMTTREGKVEKLHSNRLLYFIIHSSLYSSLLNYMEIDYQGKLVYFMTRRTSKSTTTQFH